MDNKEALSALHSRYPKKRVQPSDEGVLAAWNAQASKANKSGTKVLEAGYVYAPYIPLHVTPLIFGEPPTIHQLELPF